MRLRLSRLALASALTVAMASAASAQQRPAIDRANLDTTCAACENFFQFANGGWLKSTTIPAAYSSWGSFNELNDKNQEIVRRVLEEAARDARTAGKSAEGTSSWKVGTLYAACMDSATIESLGMKPLQPVLTSIGALRSNAQLTTQLGALEAQAGLAPFGIGAGPDPKSSSVIIASAGQGGLGLPDRDFYFRTGERDVKLRAAYLEHIERMFVLAGASAAQAKADAQTAMAFETKLAQVSMNRLTLRNPDSTYNKMSLAEFQQLTPHIDWMRFLQQQGARGVTDVNVRQLAYFKAVDRIIAEEPIDNWKAYLRWRALANAANSLSSAFVNESFRFNSQMSGAKEQQPRWKRCAATTNGVLGEAVGQEYVKRAFTPEAKRRVLEMVDNMRAVLRDQIGQLEWMSDSTKQQAIAKLDAFTRKIGYPDRWRDYSKLRVKRGAYVESLRLASAWGRAENWAKMGKPVDRGEWLMTPHTVNAYYNPLYNEIVFPAGILQPPFFFASADDAVNYGAMGAVIGHEMTHGFDDTGRRFDREGNLKDWWTAEDDKRYKERAERIVEQFNAYTVVDTATHVNGKLTLGENIADLGGLKIAYLAYKRAQAQKPVTLAANGEEPRIDGFTPDQRFFMAWAQVWRTAMRPEAARQQVLTDSHAPGMWRVNGPLSNMPEFRAAFGCKDGDPMVRPSATQGRVW